MNEAVFWNYLCFCRLLLFIQCSSKFTDQLITTGRAPSVAESGGTSVGVITKKYWSKMVQLQTGVQQITSDVSLTGVLYQQKLQSDIFYLLHAKNSQTLFK